MHQPTAPGASKPTFARRIQSADRSFIREILKVTRSTDIVSFAGGLPNPDLFPAAELAEAARRALRDTPALALQYGPSEGEGELREFIAERWYASRGLPTTADQILITSGSQQALDLIGRVLLEPGDRTLVEEPSYLGALQAFSLYEPSFASVPLSPTGPDLARLGEALDAARMFYGIPNYQNPSGARYDLAARQELAVLLERSVTVFVEDEAYRDLSFEGAELPSLAGLVPERVLSLGTFSKIVAPGLRLGWIRAGAAFLDRLLVAKQASDLHAGSLSQRVVWEWLRMGRLDRHIEGLRLAYRAARDTLIERLRLELPEVTFAVPQGGLFLWATLPEGISSSRLFAQAIRAGVAFVPGGPFFLEPDKGESYMRLNFSHVDAEGARAGTRRLRAAIESVREGQVIPGGVATSHWPRDAGPGGFEPPYG